MEKLQLDPARRTRTMQMIERCARWGMDHGLVLSWKTSRMRQDTRTVQDPMGMAPQRDHGKPSGGEGAYEDGWAPVKRFDEHLGAKTSERTLTRDGAHRCQGQGCRIE